MKIRELPFSVILELCRYLDNPTLPNQSWRGLLAKAPGEGGRKEKSRNRFLMSRLKLRFLGVFAFVELELDLIGCFRA